MVPLGSRGDYGYTENTLSADSIEVTYQGPPIGVSAHAPRSDSRLKTEEVRIYNLTLLRAAQIAATRSMPGFQLLHTEYNHEFYIESHVVPSMFYHYGYYGGWHRRSDGYYRYRPFWFNDNYAIHRYAKARVLVKLTIKLLSQTDKAANSPFYDTRETLTRLDKEAQK